MGRRSYLLETLDMAPAVLHLISSIKSSIHPLALRLRPGSSHGVVMPALFVDNEWVDGRPMARDEKGQPLPPMDLLTEVQTLLRHALNVEMLSHQIRKEKNHPLYQGRQQVHKSAPK